MKEVKILAPCGILGYGFPKQSFLNGLEQEPDAVVVDAGSTDAGPPERPSSAGIPWSGSWPPTKGGTCSGRAMSAGLSDLL